MGLRVKVEGGNHRLKTGATQEVVPHRKWGHTGEG